MSSVWLVNFLHNDFKMWNSPYLLKVVSRNNSRDHCGYQILQSSAELQKSFRVRPDYIFIDFLVYVIYLLLYNWKEKYANILYPLSFALFKSKNMIMVSLIFIHFPDENAKLNVLIQQFKLLAHVSHSLGVTSHCSAVVITTAKL